MERKKVFYTELSYALGLAILAAATALMEKADFGMSMVVAPAYILHRAVVKHVPFFSFGMSEYVFQAVLLAILSLVMKRFRRGYLFSFATAVIYGFLLDGAMILAGLIPFSGIAWRCAYYTAGIIVCSAGVALLFHTYLPPEAYELFVKEIAGKAHADIGRTKTVYDIASCLLGIALSFLFFGFGHFEGVKAGTVLCALVNGTLIGLFSRALDRKYDFRDALPWRGFFMG